VHALNNRGSARIAGRSDTDGFGDLEASVALAEEINSPEAPRALHNLGTMRYVSGDIVVAEDLGRRAIASAARLGVARIWTFSRGVQCGYLYRLGRWDEALAQGDALMAEESGALYAESNVLSSRSWIRVNRDEAEAAVEDSTRSLATARGVGDLQAMLPCLAT